MLRRLENPAMSLFVSVIDNHGRLVTRFGMVPLTTSLLMYRRFSSAPTVMTFLALLGESIPPAPRLPDANTTVNGCIPGVYGRASRTAASQLAAASVYPLEPL